MLRQLRALVAATATTAAMVVAAPAAYADPHCEWDRATNKMVCTDGGSPGGPGTPGGPGGGGGNAPTCEVTGLYNDYCNAQGDPCFRNDPAAVQDPGENGLDPEAKPHPDSHAVYWECLRADGTTYELYYWSGDEPIQQSLGERARTAIARIPLPELRAVFNPPGRTFVSLETWWWVRGATPDPVRGRALGVLAIATPDRLDVDPGDGTGVRTCPVALRRGDACTHTYRRSSGAADGSAYTARVRLIYSLRFEVGGVPTDEVEGAPSELETAWAERSVPVREAQTLVKPR
ncbi:hypothetical protein [Mumia zhuanghuii]|uniref:Secreted protein n=1 Tax=Mumia zhuanghuii TaxID=2585211 RepID=A0A5C4M704_9ACTN|nr:hypothetical protein [Mumia zhuanghuii]TNC26597.1 hypothetical protein FHE65_34490 [Mumia zhuanghuii]TNC40367.1 hypothetical protein FHE65_23435 [Mumia zhuanghuii]